MNRAHLCARPLTVFEALDDADVRTAGTTYLIYRGRHRHEPQRDSALTRIASATLMRHPVMGPRELFYADIFASRRTGCRSALGMPGVRDRHSGCVAAYLVEHDLFDFLLLSLPDNDWHSHKHGPDAQLQLARPGRPAARAVMDAAGGVERFLETHAMIVMADHSQAPVRATIALQDELAELGVLGPARSSAAAAPRASRRSPSARPSGRRWCTRSPSTELRALRAVVVAPGAGARRGGSGDVARARRATTRPREGVIAATIDGELRFRPDGEVRDPRGGRWSVEGELEVLGAEVRRRRGCRRPSYPDALARVWSALSCPTSGDVLLSAEPGYEFLDWGRQAHIGGGSHGSLRGDDSLGALILTGVDIPRRDAFAVVDS